MRHVRELYSLGSYGRREGHETVRSRLPQTRSPVQAEDVRTERFPDARSYDRPEDLCLGKSELLTAYVLAKRIFRLKSSPSVAEELGPRASYSS